MLAHAQRGADVCGRQVASNFKGRRKVMKLDYAVVNYGIEIMMSIDSQIEHNGSVSIC